MDNRTTSLMPRPPNLTPMHWGVRAFTRATALAQGSARASSSYAWVAFSLTPQVQLSRGAVYWVVLENSAASGGTGWSWWNTRNDTYIAPGVGEQSNDLGAKWGLAKGDFELRTFGYAEVG